MNRRQYETSPPLPPSGASRAKLHFMGNRGQSLRVVKTAAKRQEKRTLAAAGLEFEQ
jgi:hypothetical protein